jgi:Kdo2-lipid IVA lauroyltransferase/acyltransferase
LMGLEWSIDGTYRPHNNPVYDYIQRCGRERNTAKGTAIPRDDVRMMAKALRAGRVVWYAPDQDYGARHSIFVPLFGIPAATVTATSQLARMGKARVIGFSHTRKANDGGFHLQIYPPLVDFPSDDSVADTVRVNQFVEARIREHPEQYKTRPPGAPDVYARYGVGERKRRT